MKKESKKGGSKIYFDALSVTVRRGHLQMIMARMRRKAKRAMMKRAAKKEEIFRNANNAKRMLMLCLV